MASIVRRRSLPRQAGKASAAAAAAVACLVATAAPAAAELITLPPGEACRDFPVILDIGDDSKRNTRTFLDRNGNEVMLTTGRAESVVVTNATTGESVTVPSRGARTRQTTIDGTTTFVSTGNLLLILFSSDVGGDGLTPTSTTLTAGRTVFTVDENGVFTVQSVSGKTTDICKVLAP